MFQVTTTFLHKFLQAYDVTRLSRDERNELIEYHAKSKSDMCYLNKLELAELRVRIGGGGVVLFLMFNLLAPIHDLSTFCCVKTILDQVIKRYYNAFQNGTRARFNQTIYLNSDPDVDMSALVPALAPAFYSDVDYRMHNILTAIEKSGKTQFCCFYF